MRHQRKRHKLGRPQDQRKAVMRALASQLFLHGEIKTTMAKAKALKPYAEKLVTFGKRGDVHARRQVLRYLYDLKTGKKFNPETLEIIEETENYEGKLVEETVLRKLFNSIAKDYADKNGGYIRIFRLPPRRGDAAEMALIQLV